MVIQWLSGSDFDWLVIAFPSPVDKPYRSKQKGFILGRKGPRQRVCRKGSAEKGLQKRVQGKGSEEKSSRKAIKHPNQLLPAKIKSKLRG